MLHAKQITKIIYLPKDKQAVWEDSQKIKRRNISPVIDGLKLEWLHIELPPKTTIHCLPTHINEFEKYVLVTKGILEINVADQTFRVKKGESLYFDGSYQHDMHNPSKETIEYYIVIKRG